MNAHADGTVWSYSFRASLLDQETAWSLHNGSLEVTPQNSQGALIPLSDIRDVHLAYTRSKYAHHWFCIVTTASGRKFTLKNRHYKGLANFEERNEAYNSFMKALHSALRPYTGQVRFHSGSLGSYLFSLLFTVVGIGATLLTGYMGLWQGAIPFAALTLVLVGTLRKIKPRTYESETIPEGLLPPA